MSNVIEIRTKREDGKVFIEVNRDSLAAHVALLEVVVSEIHDRLYNMPESVVPKAESAEYEEALSFFDNMQDNLRNYDKWVSNIPQEMALDWYEKEPAPDPVDAAEPTPEAPSESN